MDLAETTDCHIRPWFFLQDGFQWRLTGPMDFTGRGWKFLCSLRVLFGLVEEKAPIGAASSYYNDIMSNGNMMYFTYVTDVFIHPRVPLVVVRYPDWSEKSTAGAVPDKIFHHEKYFQNISSKSVPGPGAPSTGRPPGWRTARGEVSVDLDVGQPGSQLPDGGPRDSLAVVTKHEGQVK